MINHLGFTVNCDVPECEELRDSGASTERTAIDHARASSWAIVHIRITKGATRSKVRTVQRCFCPMHKHLVGL